MDAVSEVKGRLNIEDVVSEYVQLKRAGRNYKALSPFTNEKTPSFIVSPEKQIWHDFSSGKGGDVISFIEQVEGLDFKGSLDLLARKAGVDLSEFSQKASTSSKVKDRLFQAVDAAVGYYQVQMTKNQETLKYLREKRGYSKQTLLDFKFGYSPTSGNDLQKFLSSKGFSDEEMQKAGLIVKRQNMFVDMFRGRVMIPLSDSQGRPVGFTARQLKDDSNSPKYINTPATILYDKSRQLFGFHRAKEYIRKSGYVVVVEGNLDVVASHQAGVGQVVASAGTALTTQHLKSIQRFTGDVRLAFDDDRAGQEAAERTIPLAQSLDMELSFISIPAGKDPDELIKQDVDAWLKTVESPQYMVDWLIDRIASQEDLSTAPGKREFTSKVLSIIRQIKDQVEQEHYIRKLADMTRTSYDSVMKKFDSTNTSTIVRRKNVHKSEPEPKEIVEQRVREQHFLSIMLSVPDFRYLLEPVPVDVFTGDAHDFYIGSDNLQNVKNNDEYAKMLTLLFEETYQHTDGEELDYQAKQLLNRLIDHYTRHKKQEIQNLLLNADENEERELLTQVNELESLRKKILAA